MLRLTLSSAPFWLDLGLGVRIEVAPLSTALMVAARADPALGVLPAGTGDEALAVIFAKALARRAIRTREGGGDAAGQPIPVTPEGIDALLDIWPVFEAFQTRCLAPHLMLEQEKNASSPLPTGTSAGAAATARPARARARTARGA